MVQNEIDIIMLDTHQHESEVDGGKTMFTNEILSTCEKACADDLSELEEVYGFKFPNEMKLFYLQYNGGNLKRREVCLQKEDWKSSTSFHKFYTVKGEFENILKEVYFEDWWIKWLIPFGHDDGGEHFCFSTRDCDYGSIYYFVSECIDDENPENAFVKVGGNLIEFINNMK